MARAGNAAPKISFKWFNLMRVCVNSDQIMSLIFVHVILIVYIQIIKYVIF